MFTIFVRKCTLVDSIPGTIILKVLGDKLHDLDLQGYYGTFMPMLIVRGIDLYTVMIDIGEFFSAEDSREFHHDKYNLGLMIGKGIKLAV